MLLEKKHGLEMGRETQLNINYLSGRSAAENWQANCRLNVQARYPCPRDTSKISEWYWSRGPLKMVLLKENKLIFGEIGLEVHWKWCY